MELLDSYLKAVKLYLPKKQRNDIARELSENILSVIEEREMTMGRTLTEADLVRKTGTLQSILSEVAQMRSVPLESLLELL
jgi:hypothetical protein